MKAVLLGLLLLASNAQAKVFQFLYIEANEGNSSGGHVAVTLGDNTYHYQHEDGRIRLFKRNANAFLLDYQLRQNRSIHSADIDVSDDTFERLNRHFKKTFFQQSQHLKHLQGLQQDQALLQALLDWHENKPPIPRDDVELPLLQGAGLFYHTKEKGNARQSTCNPSVASEKIIAEVLLNISQQHGTRFLADKIKTLTQSLHQLTSASASPHYSFSERYSDTLTDLLALQVLRQSLPLQDAVCFVLDAPNHTLTADDIRSLQNYRASLLQSVLSLVTSNRPDWGYALFVSLARLIVIEHSLQIRRWVFLDDTQPSDAPVSTELLKPYAKLLLKQRHNDTLSLHQATQALAHATDAFDRYYLKLEIAANRQRHWQLSEVTGELHYGSERPLPIKPLPSAYFLSTDVSTSQLTYDLQQKKRAVIQAIAEDRTQNQYHLLTKNCVTALFKLINNAIEGQSQQRLGGMIDPNLTFIPFQAFDAVQKNYKVVRVSDLPAYRLQKLAQLYEHDADTWVYTRESNILSSSLYNYNPEDAWFVFFTDDTVLLRPVFGAINTLAATSQSVVGLFSWPYDGGKQIKIGARGILASLPELLFFNIRKGSYPYPLEP